MWRHQPAKEGRSRCARQGRRGSEDAAHEAFARARQLWDTIGRHPNPVASTIRVALNVHASTWRIWRHEQPGPPEVEVSDELPIDPFLLLSVSLLTATSMCRPLLARLWPGEL